MTRNHRNMALALFQAGLRAADPARAVSRSLAEAGLPPGAGRLFVIAIGKAGRGMAAAALQSLTAAETLIVTTPENARPLAGARVIFGAHPVPDATSLAAGQAVLGLLAKTEAADHVLALISGGGSALTVAPAQGLTLADKAAVNQLLLRSGLDITAMNLVRQNLSRLKGGGILRAAAPAQLTALILSDVVGDDLAVVASGPTSAPIGTPAGARDVLRSAGIWAQMPQPVKKVLRTAKTQTPDPARVDNRLIGSNAQSVAAMAAAAPQAKIFPRALAGNVSEAAHTITRCKNHRTWLYGGEVTVHLQGTGLGGRNQELALRVALAAENQRWTGDWAFLSGGTDGRDGPTDAAGGLVDGGTLMRMRAAGIDPLQTLANNDSYHALKATGDLLTTGPTGTNVADLQVLIRP